MNQFDILLIIGIFLSSSMGFISGYVACYILKKEDKIIIERQGPHDSTTWQTAHMGPKNDEPPLEDVMPEVKRMSEKDDIINHDGVGIVYRPTSEEIANMDEPRVVREAKEAVAETLRQETAPEI